MQSRFVHLHLHSEFSLIDGILRIPDLMKKLPSLGMNAVALTDHCNLFAAVKLFQSALSAGIKPILGAEIRYFYPEKPEQHYPLILLCKNNLGYRNLTRLLSKAYQEGQGQGEPLLHYDWVKSHAEGLLVLSGGRKADIGQALIANELDTAQKLLKNWLSVFPDSFYLEIQRTGREDEAVYNERVVRLAEELQVPLLATNDVRFLLEEDFEAHEARVCIHEGYSLADPRRSKLYSKEQYLRSAEEMEALFADIPQAITNTVEAAKRCNVRLELGRNYLPNFPVPKQYTIETYLSHMSKQGLKARLEKIFKQSPEKLADQQPIYEQRLELEIQVINSMGFAGYFMIVADFIHWAKNNGVPVGPGRGSGAGSLVAYALGITDLDPLEYELLFERFLNPERVSMPDFDIDFCMEGRDRVIEYVAEKYGRQAVSQIITFGTMAAKAVVRDVGRVLGQPYGFVDKLAKLVPFEIGITLTKALEQEEELKRRFEEEDEVRELIDLALKLEGITRNAGKHAGGVVIAPSELTDFTAIYCEEGSTQIVSQFDKDDVEAVGLVKFDFLGLRTLTIINWALIAINRDRADKGEPPLDINDIPLVDEASFNLLKACKTTAVFQLESRGMKELIHRLQPDCFEEIIALVALFRPGPLQSGMVDDFIDRKHGRAKVIYPHPDLEPILKPTYGVILYQEQVMQIAQVLANYTLGGADLLRRAMGKKKPEEMAKQREIFVEGATARGVPAETATNIFDLMEKFAGYGFNKSHSAAYALVAYQTAWLKAHYPAAFMAAVLSSDMDNTDKIVIFIQECKKMKLTVLAPSIQRSEYSFTVQDEKTIVYGLGAIKGVGEAAIMSLVHERSLNGVFDSLFQLCSRLDLRKANRRVLEALIKSGAMDDFAMDRGILFASLDKAMQAGSRHHLSQSSGQIDLFSLLEEPSFDEEYLAVKPWTIRERLAAEKETLGYYLSGHPSESYLLEFGNFVYPIAELQSTSAKKATICGLVRGLRRIMTKRGKKLLILNLEDASALMDVVVYSEVENASAIELQTGQIILLDGELSPDEYSGGVKMLATALYKVESARARYAKCLQLQLSEADEGKISYLRALFQEHSGSCLLQISYSNKSATAMMNLPPKWAVNPSDELINRLTDLLGQGAVSLQY